MNGGPIAKYLALASLTLVALPLVGAIDSDPRMMLFANIDSYAPVHSLFVAFSFAICALIFGAGWYTAVGEGAGTMAFLSAAYLAVGLLELGHLLSFGGMPKFVTPSGGDKALAFWLAARYAGALALLGVALAPRHIRLFSMPRRYLFMAIGLAYVAAVYAITLLRPEWLPSMYIEGRGLTPFKVWAEYGVVAMHAATALLLAAQYSRRVPFPVAPLAAAAVILCASEIAFTLYRVGYDDFNVAGHVFKLIAFALIYRAVFVRAVTEPYRRLSTSAATLRQSQAHMALAQRIGHVGSIETNMVTGRSEWSAELYEILGLDPTTTAPSFEAHLALTHPDDRAKLVSLRDRNHRGEVTEPSEIRIIRPDGQMRTLLRRSKLIDADGGRSLIITFQDISDRKRVYEALRESEQLLREAARAAKIGIYVHDHATDTIYWSREQRELYAVGPDEPITLDLIATMLHPEDRERVSAAIRHAHDPASDGRFDIDYRIMARDGVLRWVLTRGSTAFEGQGTERRPRRSIGAVLDITGSKETEARLRRSESHLALAQAVARIGSAEIDLASQSHRWSDEYFRILGLDLATPPSGELFRRIVVPEDIGKIRPVAELAAEEGPIEPIIFRIRRPDGEIRWLQRYGAKIADDAGTVIALVFTLLDITELKRAEERHIQLERQLAQAQKMEAVGQLTGGVAHDFNNLLAVIQGRLRLMRDDLVDRPALREWAEICIRAAERGASLTRSLLAFSRMQTLKPASIELNAIVADMTELVRRTLGERIDVRLSMAPDLWPCLADPGQVQTALLNLAVNARDAMPDGGKLTVETRNARIDPDYAAHIGEIRAGDYVLLSVSDTGIGMSPETAARVFEPFFTTKETGRGSGLGLSMVYGFARQSGGHVGIYSELGRGTTVNLYLPRALTPAVETAPAAAPQLQRGTETVLVVDDHDEMRDLTQVQLERLGYRVVAARDPDQGLRALRDDPNVVLLITDIVLGGLSGPAFARRAQDVRPDVAVVFMTGYGQQAVADQGEVADAEAVLQKPFSLEELAQAVRTALDRRRMSAPDRSPVTP